MTEHHRTPLEQLRDMLPDRTRAEIIAGELIVYPPPSARHNLVARHLTTQLDDALGSGTRGSPRRWLILTEAGIYLPERLRESDEREYLVPDVVGWRIANAPTDLDTGIFYERPDWVCEVISGKPTRDRIFKRELYERLGVPFYWMVHPRERWIDVGVLPSTQMYQVTRHPFAPTLRAEPFDIELDLRRIFDVEL